MRKFNTFQIILPILTLLAVSLGCGVREKTVTPIEPPSQGEAPLPAQVQEKPQLTQTPDEGATDFGFPLASDAKDVKKIGGTVNYSTQMSLRNVVEFYRTEYSGQGLSEEEIMTVINDQGFSIVFGGSSNGKMLVIQGTNLGNETNNINIRYE